MTRWYRVLCCLIVLTFLASAALPSSADRQCCSITYKCQLRTDCRCLMRELRCRDPTKGILNSGKRSPPPEPDRQRLNAMESSGYQGGTDPDMQVAMLRRVLKLADADDTFLR